jgi:predicted DNA-binding ribbon-helix-helix protein
VSPVARNPRSSSPKGGSASKAAGGREGGLKLPLDPGLAQPRKRSLTIVGHRTSITLEDAFWRELQAAAAEMELSVAALVSAIDTAREPAGLSAAIRVFLLTRQRPGSPKG